MSANKQRASKYILYAILLVTIFFVGIPRILSVDVGLPYNQFYDEPLITQGALNGLKSAFDGDPQTSILPVSSEVVYGGFMRYTCMLQDAIYFQYLLMADPNVYSLNDIKTSKNGEQVLTVSHPGFYYWNRVYHVLFSVFAILMTFLLVRRLYNDIYGVIAVLIMAGNMYYFEASYVLVTNVPLAFMSITTLYFAIEYNLTKNQKFLLWSLVFCGLAASTKMTGAATILIPLVAGILNYQQLKKETVPKTILKALYLGLIPLGIFLALNPSVYLDTDLYIYWVKWLSNIYKTAGPHTAQEPGIPHLLFQVEKFINNHGLWLMTLAGLGAIVGLFGYTALGNKRTSMVASNTLIIVVFPIVYLLYVTLQYKISYHRNFLMYYSILSLLSVSGIYFIVQSFFHFVKLKPLISKLGLGVLCLLVFLLFFPAYQSIYKRGDVLHRMKDTRTQVIGTFISETSPPFHLGIEKGLKVSMDELKEIPFQYGFFSISDLDSARQGFTHLMIPDYNYQTDTLVAFPDTRIHQIDSVLSASTISIMPGSKVDFFHDLAEWVPIVNPSIKLISGSDYPPPYYREFATPVFSYELVEVVDHIEDVLLDGYLEEGSYILNYKLAGTSAEGIYPSVEIQVDELVIDTLESESRNFKPGSMKIQLDETGKHIIKIRLINDFWDPVTKEDRNAYFKSMVLKNNREFARSSYLSSLVKLFICSF